MPTVRWKRCLAVTPVVALLLPGTANADSALRLDWPGATGTTAATTYNVERKDVGAAEVRIERMEDGNVSLQSVSGFTNGERTELRALLEPVDDDTHLRPLWQESRSFDAGQNLLGTLRIDHRAGFARCTEADGTLKAELTLPAVDRVANVTLNLLFLPLVRGEVAEVEFDLFFCGLGIRFVPFAAKRISAPSQSDKLVEVRYGPNLGIASALARAMLPKLSIWFAPDAPHVWMGHRLPLYGNGPEVFVVRKGVPTRWLGDD